MAWKDARPHPENPDLILSSHYDDGHIGRYPEFRELKRSDTYTKTMVQDFKVRSLISRKFCKNLVSDSKNVLHLTSQNDEVEDDFEDRDQCTLPMKHRHCTKIYESPDCNADITELKVCVAMSLFSHTLINIIIVVLFCVYGDDKSWKEGLFGIQIVACVIFPALEFLLSPLVRFKVSEIIDSLKGEDIPSNEVIVT